MLDLGSNKIERIESIENVSHIRDLCFAKNKITKIENLDNFFNLKQLALSVAFHLYSVSNHIGQLNCPNWIRIE